MLFIAACLNSGYKYLPWSPDQGKYSSDDRCVKRTFMLRWYYKDFVKNPWYDLYTPS
jgi:hypothetical protein